MRLLLDVAVRSSLIMIVALGTSLLLRRYSAALRHWVLAAGVFSAGAVLPLSLALPAWDFRSPREGSPRRQRPPRRWPRFPLRSRLERTTTLAPVSTVHWLTVVWATGFLVSCVILIGGFSRLARLGARAERLWGGHSATARRTGLRGLRFETAGGFTADRCARHACDAGPFSATGTTAGARRPVE